MHYYKVKGGIVAVATPIDGAEEITKNEYIQLKSAINPFVWTDQMREQYERTRPLTESEVSRMLITQQINSLAVDDNTALRMVEFYPEWTTDTDYAAGFKAQYGGTLYKCLIAHTSQADWTPDAAPSLWTQICETHAGTADDPIPYSGNMELTDGLYYTQDGVMYRCTRSTGQPVYHALAELVGIYVEML